MKFYKYFRWWNWLISFFGGFFWLPCPRCQKNFGGHEWIHPSQSLGSYGICLECYEVCKVNGEIQRDIDAQVASIQKWHEENPQKQSNSLDQGLG